MITEDADGKIKFNLSHHFASRVQSAGNIKNAGRARRLAQEAVTLSTSLPLSSSSTVFVRCDEDRLDVMKVNGLKTYLKKSQYHILFSVILFGRKFDVLIYLFQYLNL